VSVHCCAAGLSLGTLVAAIVVPVVVALLLLTTGLVFIRWAQRRRRQREAGGKATSDLQGRVAAAACPHDLEQGSAQPASSPSSAGAASSPSGQDELLLQQQVTTGHAAPTTPSTQYSSTTGASWSGSRATSAATSSSSAVPACWSGGAPAAAQPAAAVPGSGSSGRGSSGGSLLPVLTSATDAAGVGVGGAASSLLRPSSSYRTSSTRDASFEQPPFLAAGTGPSAPSCLTARLGSFGATAVVDSAAASGSTTSGTLSGAAHAFHAAGIGNSSTIASSSGATGKTLPTEEFVISTSMTAIKETERSSGEAAHGGGGSGSNSSGAAAAAAVVDEPDEKGKFKGSRGLSALLKARSDMAVLRDLKIGPLLGRGSYGRVYKGEVQAAHKLMQDHCKQHGYWCLLIL